MRDFRTITRNFLLGESREDLNPAAIMQSLRETLSNLRPASRTDQNRIEVAKSHLNELTRSFRRMQEQMAIMEEKLKILEEESSMGGGSIEGAAVGVTKDKKNVK